MTPKTTGHVAGTLSALAGLLLITGCTGTNPAGPEPADAAEQGTSSGTPRPSQTDSAEPEESRTTEDPLRTLSGEQLTVRVDDQEFTVDLYDNPTVEDLLTRLPLTLTANDYPGYDEKVVRLDEPLSMQDAPEGDEPLIPEVGYYEPGNWIALYYGPIGYWPGKVPVGQIDAEVDELRNIPDGASITFEAGEN